MVRFEEGDDIFEYEGDWHVVTVNCIGAMGAGVALAFAERERGLFARYKSECAKRQFTIGKGAVYDGKVPGRRYILLPTKTNWRAPSSYNHITKGLQWLTQLTHSDIKPGETIVMPPLGCGHGQLSFHSVSLMIVQAAKEIPNDILVVYPWHSPPHPSLQNNSSLYTEGVETTTSEGNSYESLVQLSD